VRVLLLRLCLLALVFQAKRVLDCLNISNFSTHFTDGERIGYGEWNGENKTFTTTLRQEYTAGLESGNNIYSLAFKLLNQAQPPSTIPDIGLEVDIHGSMADVTQDLGTTQWDNAQSNFAGKVCRFWRDPWPRVSSNGIEKLSPIMQIKSVPLAMSLSQSSLLPSTRNVLTFRV
jgi:hypothetical protein